MTIRPGGGQPLIYRSTTLAEAQAAQLEQNSIVFVTATNQLYVKVGSDLEEVGSGTTSTSIRLGDAGTGVGGELAGGDYYYAEEPGTAGYQTESVFISVHDNPGTLDGAVYELRGGIEVDMHESGAYTGSTYAPSRTGITVWEQWAPTAGTTGTNNNNLFGIYSQAQNKAGSTMAPHYMRAVGGFSYSDSGAARMGASDMSGIHGFVGDFGVTPADGTPSNTAFDSSAIAAQVQSFRPNGIYSGVVVKSPVGSGVVDKLFGLRVRDQSGHADTTYALGIDAGGVANSITWANDTNLYRSSANNLTTDDTFNVTGPNIVLSPGAANAADTGLSVTSSYADGYRAYVALTNSHTGGRAFSIVSTNNADGVYGGSKLGFHDLTGGAALGWFDSGGALTVIGGVLFGAANDTNLYRSAANTLQTDDSFVVVGNLYVQSDATSLFFGASNDVQLTRGAANTLTLGSGDSFNITLGTLKVAGTSVVGAQGAAVADATDAGTAITQLNLALARLRAHGLIAT